MKKIIIFGAGGHAKVAIDVIEKEKKYQIVTLVDDQKMGTSWYGIQVLSFNDAIKLKINQGLVAIGDNWTRGQLVNQILSEKPKFEFISTIHPSAQIARGAKIGKGSVIFPAAVIGPDAQIGNHVIVNTAASVDHDCKIEDYCSLAPRATLGGKVNLGQFSAVGLGANVIHSVSIGKSSVVGAGATVVESLPPLKVSVGLPAKPVRSRLKNEPYL